LKRKIILDFEAVLNTV